MDQRLKKKGDRYDKQRITTANSQRQQEIKRNFQHLANIGLMGVLGNFAAEAKEKGDGEGKTLIRAGLFCIFISEILILISEINDCRKARTKEE